VKFDEDDISFSLFVNGSLRVKGDKCAFTLSSGKEDCKRKLSLEFSNGAIFTSEHCQWNYSDFDKLKTIAKNPPTFVRLTVDNYVYQIKLSNLIGRKIARAAKTQLKSVGK